MIVGASFAAPGGRIDAGATYVVFGGGALPANFEFSSLLGINGGDGSAGFVINGIDAQDRSGLSVAGAGDVNDDGFDDIIIGANKADPGGRGNAGEAYVIFGTATIGVAEFELSGLQTGNGGNGKTMFFLPPGPSGVPNVCD